MGERTLNKLIERVYPDLLLTFDTAPFTEYLSERTIMTPLNTTADMLNAKLLAVLPGEEHEVRSADRVEELDDAHLVPVEFLNKFNPSGFPHHVLRLKAGSPIMLLRNLDSPNGLSNGTRLIVRAVSGRLIDAEILGGQHKGNRVWIPRIPMTADPQLTGKVSSCTDLRMNILCCRIFLFYFFT